MTGTATGTLSPAQVSGWKIPGSEDRSRDSGQDKYEL